MTLTTAYITDLRQLGYQLATKELTNFVSIHGVSVDFINRDESEPVTTTSSADDLVKMRIHGVTPNTFARSRADHLRERGLPTSS